MDYLELYRSYKGKFACSKRGEYWRQFQPYCVLINEESNLMYPLNRFYKKLGQPKNTEWIQYPEYTTTIYLYDDGTKPFDTIAYCKEYILKLHNINSRYNMTTF